MATFRDRRIVEFADTDMAGIVHFARFFCYMEAAEHALLRALGLSVTMDWEGEHISFPRVGASCDYLKPARFEDVLAVDARVLKVGKKSVTYGFDVLRGEEVLARGQVTSVCCTVGPGRRIASREIPKAIRDKLERVKG
jgi:acyl-CoA thioester hydrolase